MAWVLFFFLLNRTNQNENWRKSCYCLCLFFSIFFFFSQYTVLAFQLLYFDMFYFIQPHTFRLVEGRTPILSCGRWGTTPEVSTQSQGLHRYRDQTEVKGKKGSMLAVTVAWIPGPLVEKGNDIAIILKTLLQPKIRYSTALSFETHSSSRESGCLGIVPKHEGKKAVSYLKGTFLTYSEWKALLVLYSTPGLHCLIQNVNCCIIDSLKEMIQYPFTYSFNITSLRTLRCAQVCCK